MELQDSVDKEFNEYEKIYLCSGVAIALSDEMIRDISKRSRPCNRNRIIITRFIKVLCRLNNIIQHDINQFNVALEEFQSNKKRLMDFIDKYGMDVSSLKIGRIIRCYYLMEHESRFFSERLKKHIPEVVFKDKISKLKLFCSMCSESFKEIISSPTEVDFDRIFSLIQLESESFVFGKKLLFAMVADGEDVIIGDKEDSTLSVTKRDATSGDHGINDYESQLVTVRKSADAMNCMLEKVMVHAEEMLLSFDSIISESESYRDDLLKLKTKVNSEEFLPSLLSPPKGYEDSKIALEIRKHIVDDLMSLKNILMGVIFDTEASSPIREMLEPKYRFYDKNGGFNRNISKIFSESGAKTFYRCPGESVIFLHGEKEEEEFIAIFRTSCDKLSEKECTELFCYTKESNLGVSKNEECSKTVRTGDYCRQFNLFS